MIDERERDARLRLKVRPSRHTLPCEPSSESSWRQVGHWLAMSNQASRHSKWNSCPSPQGSRTTHSSSAASVFWQIAHVALSALSKSLCLTYEDSQFCGGGRFTWEGKSGAPSTSRYGAAELLSMFCLAMHSRLLRCLPSSPVRDQQGLALLRMQGNERLLRRFLSGAARARFDSPRRVAAVDRPPPS